jgi:hypothetical protein
MKYKIGSRVKYIGTYEHMQFLVGKEGTIQYFSDIHETYSVLIDGSVRQIYEESLELVEETPEIDYNIRPEIGENNTITLVNSGMIYTDDMSDGTYTSKYGRIQGLTIEQVETLITQLREIISYRDVNGNL